MEIIIEKYELLCRKYQVIEEESGEKEIHDKRVILRRVFSILALYKISPFKVKHGKESFRIFGKLRDIQVQISELENKSDEYEIHEYFDYLKKLEISVKEKIEKFSRKKHVIFPEVKERNVSLEDMKKEVEKRLKKLVKKTEQIRKKDARSIHKVRIEFKKFRYMLENLANIEKTYEAKIDSLKKYQDLLGEIQDAQVLLNGLIKFYGKGRADRIKYIQILKKNKELKIEIFIEEMSKNKNILLLNAENR